MQKENQYKNSSDVKSSSTASAWIDIDLNKPESDQWLKNESNLNKHLVDELCERNYCNRRQQFENGTLINLCHTKNTTNNDTTDINFFVDENRVIAVHWGMEQVITKFDNIMKDGTSHFSCWDILASVFSILSDEMEERVSNVGIEVDKLEDQILEQDHNLPMDELGSLRRLLMRMRRYKKPVANLINNISHDMTIFIDQDVRNQMNETADQIRRHADTIELYMERALLMQDQIQNQLYEGMNKATYRLGVVATVFLPLSFITGLLGINVAGIPGDHNHHAFWLVCILLIFVAIASTYLINRKREF